MVFWVFQFMPSAPNPTAAEMNWSVVVWSGVVIFFTTYFVVQGRFTYEGPVAHVRKDGEAGSIEL